MKKITNENEQFGARINSLIQQLDNIKTKLIKSEYLHKQSLQREQEYKRKYSESKQEVKNMSKDMVKYLKQAIEHVQELIDIKHHNKDYSNNADYNNKEKLLIGQISNYEAIIKYLNQHYKSQKLKFDDAMSELYEDIFSLSGENYIYNDKLTSVIRERDSFKKECDIFQSQNECLRKQVIYLQKKLKNNSNYNEFDWNKDNTINGLNNGSDNDSDIEIINKNPRKRSESVGIVQTSGLSKKKRRLN